MLLTPLINEDQVLEAVENHLTLTITSLPEAEIVDKVTRLTRRMAAVHLKVDTGLGRFGMNLEQTLQCCELLKQNSHIYIEGIYTHMAEGAARSTRYTQNQFNQFMKVVNGLMERGYIFPIRHCANSAVLLNYPHMQLDAVRVGTLISGQHPAGKSDTAWNCGIPITSSAG